MLLRICSSLILGVALICSANGQEAQDSPLDLQSSAQIGLVLGRVLI
jgi:hypothetical protein